MVTAPHETLSFALCECLHVRGLRSAGQLPLVRQELLRHCAACVQRAANINTSSSGGGGRSGGSSDSNDDETSGSGNH
eukprot:gene10753-biopygen2266